MVTATIEEGMGGLAVTTSAAAAAEDLFPMPFNRSLKISRPRPRARTWTIPRAMGGTLLTWAAEFHRVDLCQWLLDARGRNSRDGRRTSRRLGVDARARRDALR